MNMPKHSSSPRFYGRVAIGFSALTALLALVIAALSLSRAAITLVPRTSPLTLQKVLTVIPSSAPSAPDAIPGTVITKTVTLEGDVPVTGGTLVPDRAHGSVTVINTYDRNQPLVATTRLLSPEGVLFRITDTVTVPAGGETEVEARADIPGKEGEAHPTRFTIPGLRQELQDKIYAVSKTPMTGGERRISAITEADIEKARTALARVSADALQQLKWENENNDTFISFEQLNEKVMTPVGEEAQNARIQGMYRITTVRVDPEILATQLQEKIPSRQDSALAITSLNPIELSVDRLTADGAVVSVTQRGTATILLSSQGIDKKRLTGEKASVARQILQSIPDVSEAQITLRPKFLPYLPFLSDHITITVQNPSAL
ncbi:hypothetical protein A3I42_03880 [Candidatus Uhrbacteria bacterium RIFCSPLOWO2_02_FULL_49_11]|uniref:Baseplate protein J-like domain-containing protein n=1 Tax=Candidatus Uhrbacteria bacterium RIFCSPLOWO2_02_FULL_49_11 TaxID=1802409 RepID=A0A1F7VBH3_9BACT|nr:MAG: hypothetical protein A3I42_03880 [Candidatus Uhrbacteria bacterium RIFCSPLOWO2_02_FULL_49_11]